MTAAELIETAPDLDSLTPLNAAINAVNENTAATTDPGQLLIAAKVRGLMRGYDARWINSGYVPIGVEEFISSDLWNPETGRKSRSFISAGVQDVLCRYDGRLVLFDHKTTSDDISDPNSPYWRQLVVEGQPSHYMLINWINGQKIDGAVWDVVRKPGISPKNIARKDQDSIWITGRYYGYGLSGEELDTLKIEGRESMAMYEARLADDCINERPQWYFQRKLVPRLDNELIEYAKEQWEHSQEILHARNTNRWSRNSGGCLYKNSPCKFLGICSGHDEPDSDNWKPKDQVHAELPITDGDGRNVLTNSRIRTFQTCRRKHFYEYELGIQRVDEEEREALWFGTLYHLAQAAWWTTLKEQYGNTNDTSAEGSELSTAGNSTK